jgi:hypothetical protein
MPNDLHTPDTMTTISVRIPTRLADDAFVELQRRYGLGAVVVEREDVVPACAPPMVLMAALYPSPDVRESDACAVCGAPPEQQGEPRSAGDCCGAESPVARAERIATAIDADINW